MTPLDLKQRMTLVKFLTELLASRRRDVLLPEADEEFTQGERFAVKFGGRIAAWITVPRASRYSGSIKDKDKFLRWVKDNRPDEIVTVEAVRESYAEAVMKDVREHGGLFDKESGEVVAVAGIEVTPGKSVPRVELEDDAEEIIGAAWRDGLDIGPLLALPPGGDEAA